MADLRALTTKYLETFSRKDLDGLAAQFADEVVLRDPTLGAVQGKAAVLAANATIFGSVKTIEARPLTIHVAGNTAIAELEVHVDGKLALLIADVIDFDADGKITAIRAYRGN